MPWYMDLLTKTEAGFPPIMISVFRSLFFFNKAGHCGPLWATAGHCGSMTPINWGRCLFFILKVFTQWYQLLWVSILASWLFIQPSLKSLIYFSYAFHFYVCMFARVYICMWVWVPAETRRGRQIHWRWSYRWLCSTWCRFWELQSSTRAASTLYHWDIFPAPINYSSYLLYFFSIERPLKPVLDLLSICVYAVMGM